LLHWGSDNLYLEDNFPRCLIVFLHALGVTLTHKMLFTSASTLSRPPLAFFDDCGFRPLAVVLSSILVCSEFYLVNRRNPHPCTLRTRSLTALGLVVVLWRRLEELSR
jgi:hypothetical protein